jgi:hypothetical protein
VTMTDLSLPLDNPVVFACIVIASCVAAWAANKWIRSGHPWGPFVTSWRVLKENNSKVRYD